MPKFYPSYIVFYLRCPMKSFMIYELFFFSSLRPESNILCAMSYEFLLMLNWLFLLSLLS